MLDPRRYHYQPTISFPVSDDRIQQKTHTKNYNNFHHHHHDQHVEDESGMCSPPLWTTKSKSNNYRSLSPESKTQAIERGQRELMEMVKNMPESSYELTLKDLVEEHHVEENNKVKERNLSNKNTRKREGIRASRNMDKKNIDSGGLYLKMVFPISLGSSKKHDKKKELLVSNKSSSNSKVSPRASVSDGSVSKDWWKKKLGSSGSECGGDQSDHSGVSSMNGSIKRYGSSRTSSCSSRSNSRHEMSTSRCWPFIRRSQILSEK